MVPERPGFFHGHFTLKACSRLKVSAKLAARKPIRMSVSAARFWLHLSQPYWKSRVLRRQALGGEGDGGDHGSKGDEAV